MKYIIMCGGDYKIWSTPRQCIEINGEAVVARTIRLLKECGIEDILISSNNPIFEQFGVPVLKFDNEWEVFPDEEKGWRSHGTWCNGFYLTSEPVCYLLGDVVFSKKAIQTIVGEEVEDVMFFASAPPFAENYPKTYAEPFAFKVVNTQYFKQCIDTVKEIDRRGQFKRDPIAWELWQIIAQTPINTIDYTNYRIINDFTCDIDTEKDIEKFKSIIDC